LSIRPSVRRETPLPAPGPLDHARAMGSSKARLDARTGQLSQKVGRLSAEKQQLEAELRKSKAASAA